MSSDWRKRNMANHGDGNKYASVNLNKSYGYQSHQQHNQSRSYGTNRGRGGGGYGQGGMLVLSRPRSSQNSVPKLSVPPPLNLPSLRKEHERVDASGLGLHSGGAIAGSGTRPSSSGMGWSKLASTTTDADIANHTVEGATRAMEPAFHHVEKVATLRGEDFPSLKASLPAASVSGQKQKEGMNQNQKPGAGEEFPKELRGASAMRSSLVDMRPQNHSGRSRLGNEGSGSASNSDGLLSFEQVRKKDYFSGPLPLVPSAAHSDWADDERDTSRGIEAAKNSNYTLSSSRENVWNNTRGREAPYQHGGRQPWNNNMDSSSNRGTFNREWDNRPVFKSDKPHMENPSMKDFGDSGFDVHDPFPVLGVAKKKKEALKQIEFHDPVRELFEAELELVQKMQEEERRRNIEEQERVIELAREQDERQRRIEENAREAVLRNKQESLEAVRRAEELRKSKEEEKHRLLMEEERRMQAAKQKLLELEERISRREAEAVKGCSSSSTISEDKFLDIVKQKESADVVDWEDSERMVERITTSSTVDLPVPIRYFENSTTSQFSSDSSFGFPNRQKPTWRKEDIESGSNSRFTPQNMENVPHSSQEELFGITGYPSASSYFKPGFPDHSVDQSWRIPGDGRAHARNYGMESESRENFGDQYGDPGWRQNQGRAHHGPYPTYPEKGYQNPDGDDCYPFGRRRYSVRQPRVLPPLQESRQKASFRRGEGEHPGSSTSVGGINYTHTSKSSSTVLASYIGDLQDHHVLPRSGIDEHRRFDSKLTRRCDSQSSLSVTSPPDSPIHLSDDDLDKSADSSALATSRKGDDVGLLNKRGGSVIFSDSEKDSLMIAPGTVSCWDNEDWTLESNEQLQDQEKYDEDKDGYQEEDKVHGVDENIDLAQKLGEMYLEDKESNLVLGFDEGVEVEIPSDDFGKCQQNVEATIPLPHHTVESLDDERSIKTGCGEQADQPIEVSDSLSMHNASRNFQGSKAMMQNLHTSSLPTAIPPVSTTLEPMEEAVKFQFGLFSGPSLIPSLFPTIQIGSIQMPLPLHPQFGSSVTHVPQLQSPTIQFGRLGYTPPISQELLPPPHHTVDQVNGLSTYALNQNPGSSVTFDLGQGNSANLADRNAENSVSNHRCSVLNRPMDVSDGGTLKTANTSPARASIESAVGPEKQPELSGRNSGSCSSGAAEGSRVNSGGSRRYRRQKLEFRVRESNWPPSEENQNGNGRAQNFTKNRGRKYVVSNKSQKQGLDCSVSSSNAMQKTVSGGSFEKRVKKDAPLQGGIVCIFEQHDTEALSDHDDFIEVKSKRQMLNDRREKREKEIKEKSQASKASRKPRLSVQNSTTAARSSKSAPAIRVANNKLFNPAHNRRPLAPIGTPSPKTDSHGDEKSGSNKSTEASSSVPVVPGNDPASDFVFSNKKVLDNSNTSTGTWGNQLTYQPVMALTQSQLDDAMKPVSLLSCVSDETGANRISKPTPTSTSVVPENSTFSSSTSPINSLLAEGKIQFGAVSSSTVIPLCGGRTENDSSLYFEKDKQRNPSTTGMEICESEPGASTIAVAAITNDETGGNTLSTDSVLPAETKIYGAKKLDDGAASGTVGRQPSLSKAEESLIVSLPADLSVDNPITLWPPLLSPHNSNQMVTHFPPGPPHYPFFEVNPMLRGPIFAFGPHHDTGANQSQSQKGPGTVSGPPTTWQQQSHSGVDSFYAPPPAGFTGPFLSPPGAMPGVQGPAHMFVYNHFAPVGQFGGLSFMGTTYIPSGKQPDLKHNPVVSSSPMGGDGDVNNPNVASMQCNIVPASLQHLPMPMFDPSLFQSSSQEMLARGAQWPYMPFSGPPTMQTQKQQEAADGSSLPSPQFNDNMLPPPNRYPNNIQASTAANTMVDSSSNAYSSTTCAPPPKPTTTLSDPNSNNTQNPTGLGFKPPPPPQQEQQSSQEKNTPYQNVGGSSHHSHQQNHNRRWGFHGRNQQPMARERGFQNSRKVKQIYVAKQTQNSNVSTSSTTTTTLPTI